MKKQTEKKMSWGETQRQKKADLKKSKKEVSTSKSEKNENA